MSNGDEVEAICALARSHHEAFWELYPRPRRPQYGTGVSRKLPNFPYWRLTMVLQILVRRFGNVAGGTHFQATAGMLSFPRMRFNQDSIGERLWPETTPQAFAGGNRSSASPTSTTLAPDISRPEIGSRTDRALSFRNGDGMDCPAHSRFVLSAGRGLDRQRRQRFASENG